MPERVSVKYVSRANAWVRTTWDKGKDGRTVQKQEWSTEPFEESQ
jgi:hypothetical protein